VVKEVARILERVRRVDQVEVKVLERVAGVTASDDADHVHPKVNMI